MSDTPSEQRTITLALIEKNKEQIIHDWMQYDNRTREEAEALFERAKDIFRPIEHDGQDGFPDGK